MVSDSSFFIYILSALLGLTIGSFLNVVVYRTEKNKTLGGRSYCPKCKKTIAWYDNIPLISFLVLGGHCRFCRKKISWQYPLVEMLTSFLFLGATFLVLNNLLSDWFGHYFGMVGMTTIASRLGLVLTLTTSESILKLFELLFLWIILCVLVSILVYDLKHMLIPDCFSLTGIFVAIFYNIVADALLLAAAIIPHNQNFILEVAGLSKRQQLPGFFSINVSSFFGRSQENFYSQIIHLKSFFPDPNYFSDTAISFTERPMQFALSLITGTRSGSGLVAGLAIAFIFFSIVYISKETWMGMGDVKLVFFLGLFLGIFKTAVALFIAFEIGAILGIILIIAGRAKMKTALPFGPFLILGTILSLFFV